MCLPFRRRNLCATRSMATPMQSTTSLTSPSSSNIFSLNSSHLHVIGSSMCSSFRSFHSRRYHHKSSASAFSNLTFQNQLYPLPTLPLVSGVQLSSFRNVHDDCKDLAKLMKRKRDKHMFQQLTDLMYEGLFGNNRCTILTENEKNVAYYNRFLETVDLIGQNVSPDEDSSDTSHNATPPPPPITTPTSSSASSSDSSSASSSASSSISSPTSKSKEHHRHRRIFCYGVARWIDNRTYCNSPRFEDFYQNELPSFSRVKDSKSERFLKQWTEALSDADFRHYLSTTIMNVIKKARRDVKAPFTMADMAKRYPDHRRHLRGLSKTFSRVLVTKEDVESLESRNIKFYELFVPAEKDIPLQPDKVSVVSGSSGSGKTITALAAATREPADVVFYTIVENDLLRSQLAAPETTCITSEQKTRRNKIVKEWVMEQINKILEEIQYALLVDDLVLDYNVVIVVDDVGSYSGFLAGLCASLADLSIELHNKFFPTSLDPVANKEDWHEKSRIRFVAAGSGASFGIAYATPNVDRYNTYFIGKQNSTNTDFETAPIFATILSGFHKDLLGVEGVLSKACLFVPSSVFERCVKLLKRLDPAEQRRIRMANQQTIRDYEANPEDSHKRKRRQEAWITPTEKAAADLVTNARCAALLIKVALADTISAADEVGKGNFEVRHDLLHPEWWESVAAFNKRLQCWIPVIIEKYMSMNGLVAERDPLEALRHALAATIFRLPCLPDSAPWLWWALDSSYTAGLISNYGVLVDYATATKSTKGIISLDDFADLREQDRMCALKVDETTARYYTSPAHVAMFRSRCGLTLDRPPELSDSSSFKYDIAEFCALTLICASAYTDMVEKSKFLLLDWKTKRTLLDRFDEKCNYKYDSLFGLKEKLARDYCPAGFTGAKIIHLFDSPLLSMPKYIVEPNDDDVNKLEKTARAKATMLRTEIEASLRHENAAVIISKEMESFADVIVVSSGRVMLIQCKQKSQPRKKLTIADDKHVLVNGIDWIDEIEKMCGLDSQSMQHSDQKSRAEKMRNIYLDELKSAAAAVDGSSDVKVELVFVVEGEKAVCNLFAKDFKRLQVTDENTKKNENDQQLFPSISAGAKTISAEKYFHEKKETITVSRTTRGYPISFFGVHRRRQTTTGQAPSSSSHSYPPPLFPVPDYSEGVRDDSGCSFAIGEHQPPYEYEGRFWTTNFNPYEGEE